ncbi:hypothetical protein K438DRAFT_1752646 [Mycena galopus ATCC 62051]|nr:hypothetical protein K438DRAFT_1752646 [Mycena galopus ATCC 62051]
MPGLIERDREETPDDLKFGERRTQRRVSGTELSSSAQGRRKASGGESTRSVAKLRTSVVENGTACSLNPRVRDHVSKETKTNAKKTRPDAMDSCLEPGRSFALDLDLDLINMPSCGGARSFSRRGAESSQRGSSSGDALLGLRADGRDRVQHDREHEPPHVRLDSSAPKSMSGQHSAAFLYLPPIRFLPPSISTRYPHPRLVARGAKVRPNLHGVYRAKASGQSGTEARVSPRMRSGQKGERSRAIGNMTGRKHILECSCSRNLKDSRTRTERKRAAIWFQGRWSVQTLISAESAPRER